MEKDEYTLSIIGDITKDEVDLYAPHIKAKLVEIARDSVKSIQIITPLHNPTDRLLAHIAIELGIEFVVLLPMPRELLIRDFDDASLAEFNYLISQAHSIDTIPLYWDNTLESIAKDGVDREYQCMELRRILAKESDEMIVLWDEVESYEFGSTAHIVSMRRDDYGRSVCVILYKQSGTFR